ncbi:MAG: DUF3822 family protein [Bacteroidota bacterium]
MTGLITDPGFDKNHTKEYKLSIQVSLDGFSFSVIHASQKQLLALEALPLELSSTKFLGRHFKGWVRNNEILQAKYHSTSVIYYPENTTFIPSGIYDHNHQDTVGKLVFGNQKDNLFIDNYLPNASGNLVFPVVRNLSEEVQQFFPEQKLIHPAVILDKEISRLYDTSKGTMALYFGRKNFTLFIYTGSKLKAITSYNYTNSGDVVYYTITSAKKLKLIPEKTTLFMAGDIIQKGEIHESLKRIFNRTIILIPPVQYNSNLFKEPLHRFIVLF